MTAPVSTQPVSEKIAMTAPVSQIPQGKGYSVQFTMPSKYSMETIPQPNDARVVLKEIPAKRYAVYAYSGSWSQSKYEKKLAEFKEQLTNDNLTTIGKPLFARFNSPFQLWFLRRNEIWIELPESPTTR